MMKDSAERKKRSKATFGIPVTYSVNNKSFRGMAREFSMGGVLIQCRNPLRLNSIVQVKFDGGPLKKPIDAECEVVWTNQYGPDDEITPRGMLVKLDKIDENDRQILEHLTNSVEAK